ncbi:type III secretion apparatus protein OrgA/MxiK [Sodalis sp.]|uniref:type III secretion apparatus protein OrgA/MxiK n=1 Tax=Sodalis sp. (in: enterobacteria) TaxID=1898979 RepID=UPI003873542F
MTPLRLANVMRVMYHPVSYLHTSRFPSGWRREDEAAHPLLNHWILRHYHCPDDVGTFSHDPFYRLLIDGWQRLGDAALLIGAHLLRNRLLADGRFILLAPPVQSFLALPLPQLTPAAGVHEQEETAAALLHHPDPAAWGAYWLLSRLKHFPPAVYRRACLLFPAVQPLPQQATPLSPSSINLIKMALHHAQYVTR